MGDQKEIASEGRTTRRGFLRGAGLATAGLLAADWARSASFSLAAPRVIGANDRINFGVIGCGGMGTNHIRSLVDQAQKGESNLQITAVCDIYEPRKERAKSMTGAKLYHDYRELLADKNVDVVLIATPEHWHCKMTVDAMEAGKDVYLEKPMTRYLDEAKTVLETTKRTGRILQVGSQGCSEPRWQQARELVPKIGKVVWSQTSYCRNVPNGEWNYGIDSGATPQNLDWKAWLGPAPDRPFDRERYFRWRKYWDYSSGIAGDLYPHRIHPLMIALGAELPVRVVSTGGIYVQKDREVPDTLHMLADFPSGHTMLVAGSTCNEHGLPTMIRGNQGNMFLEGGDILVRPERPYAEEFEESRTRVQGIGDSMRAHEKNFMDCVRTRAVPNCGPDLAYAVMVTVALGEIAYRKNKVALFDPEKRELIS